MSKESKGYDPQDTSIAEVKTVEVEIVDKPLCGTRQAMLDAMLDPANHGSPSKIIKVTGHATVQSYYDALKDPRFVRALEKRKREMVATSKTVDGTIKRATNLVQEYLDKINESIEPDEKIVATALQIADKLSKVGKYLKEYGDEQQEEPDQDDVKAGVVEDLVVLGVTREHAEHYVNTGSVPTELLLDSLEKDIQQIES